MLLITGSASDNGTVIRYEWDFDGNGIYDFESPSTGNTAYTYASPGTYNPIFKVTDNDGNLGYNASLTIYVGDLTVTPTADPTSGDAPLNVTLDGVIKGISPGRYITLYEWDFEGDGIFDLSNSAGPNITHRYDFGAVYTAILRVTDNAGKEAYGSVTISVNKVAPVAHNNAAPVSGIVPLKVNLNGAGSDQDGSIVLFEWDYDGDGSYDWYSESTGDTEFFYETPGTYTPTIRVTDNDGFTETESKEITANERQDTPLAAASADVTEGTVPLTVNLTGTGTDPDDGTITLYEWDFEGDRNYDTSSPDSGDASHEYTEPGQYTATLRVTDSDGLTATDSVLITVKDTGYPTAQANANPKDGDTPLKVNFDATGSSDPDGPLALYEWAFGDEIVWVADYNNNHVVSLKGYREDNRLTGFYRPYRLSINENDGSVWVSDHGNNQVVKLDQDGSELNRISGFNGPNGLEVNQNDGSVWIADFNNHQIVKLDSDGAELVRSTGFNNPTSVSVDQRDGSVWITEYYRHQVVKLSPDGIERVRVSGFNHPFWLDVNSHDGSVWVAERYNHRIVKLSENTPDGYNASVQFVTPDLTFYKNEGLLFGNTTSGEGNLSGGMTFDGDGDYILLSQNDSLNVQSFTVEAWVKLVSSSGWRIIFY